jgi:hypothetical protein
MTHIVEMSGSAFNRFFSSILQFALVRVCDRLEVPCGL